MMKQKSGGRIWRILGLYAVGSWVCLQVVDVLDPTPTVPGDVLDLCRWMSDYYLAPLGIALRAALPRAHAALRHGSRLGVGPVNGAVLATDGAHERVVIRGANFAMETGGLRHVPSPSLPIPCC